MNTIQETATLEFTTNNTLIFQQKTEGEYTMKTSLSSLVELKSIYLPKPPASASKSTVEKASVTQSIEKRELKAASY